MNSCWFPSEDPSRSRYDTPTIASSLKDTYVAHVQRSGPSYLQSPKQFSSSRQPMRRETTSNADNATSTSSKPRKGRLAQQTLSTLQNPSLINGQQVSLLPALPINPTSSGAWTPTDDATLMAARASGMNWSQIQQTCFLNKTANACRKRHERLMERRTIDDWDNLKLENLADNYMGMRREIWTGLADLTGEKWGVVEQKCMSQGLKNLQTHARSKARRERLLDGTAVSPIYSDPMKPYAREAYTDGTGIGTEDQEVDFNDDSIRNTSTQRVGSFSTDSHSGSSGVGSNVLRRPGEYVQHGQRLPSTGMEIGNIVNRPSKNRADETVYLQDQSHVKSSIKELQAPASHHFKTQKDVIVKIAHAGPTSEKLNEPQIINREGLETALTLELENLPSVGKNEDLQSVLDAQRDAHEITETFNEKPAVSLDTSISPSTDRTAQLDDQQISRSFQIRRFSLASESSDSLVDTKSEFSYEDLSTDTTRKLSAVLSLTGILRQRLLCMLTKTFYVKRNGGQSTLFRGCQGDPPEGSPSTGPSSTTGSSAPPSSTKSSQSRTMNQMNGGSAKKKRAMDDDEDSEQDNRRDGKRSRRDPPKIPASPPKVIKFPCPYHKHDPNYFGMKTGVDVCRGHWPSIGRVKEHLYRRHYVEFQCQRCKIKLNSRTELDQHAESNTPCKPRERQLKDGFTFEIFLVLHNKKKSFPGQNEEDRWREIYQLLFPSAESIPDPSYESGNLFAETISMNHNISLEDFSSFALPEEFKRIAKVAVARTVRPFETQLFSQVSSIARDSKEAVEARYQELQGKLFTNSGSMMDRPGSSTIPQPEEVFFPPVFDIDQTKESSVDKMNCHFNALDQDEFDLSLCLWESPNDSYQQMNETRSLDSQLVHGQLTCSCLTDCTCQMAQARSSSTISQSGLHGNVSSLTKDSEIVALLQHMSRSIAALEKRMQTAD